MIFKKGLLEKNLEILKKRSWYHQRFDGSPNLMFLIGQMELKAEKRKGRGGEFTRHLVVYDKNRVDWYMDQEDLDRITKIFVKKSHRESYGIGKRMMKKWDKNKFAVLKLCRLLDKINLAELSNNNLIKAYSDFIDAYLGWTSMSSLIDGFALGSDEYIQNEINILLDDKSINNGRGLIFSTLTAPVNQSFINEAEISLLKLAQKISLNKKLKKFFINNLPKEILKKIEKFPFEFKILKNHQKNYFWSKNNYVDANILDELYFIKELKELFSGRINIKEQIKRIKNTPQKNKEAKKKLIKKLVPPKHLVNLIEISETFTYWQDERKKLSFLATHYVSIFLSEIGKRLDYSLDEMKHIYSNEIISLFKNKKTISRENVKQRKDYCLHYDYKNYYETLTGLHAKKLYNDIFLKKEKKDIDDFRGLSASSGKVSGRVKIVKSVHEVEKVKKGDILVAVMTRPDYIMGIKKASAIVTNEGGVTCHAAIVARELGIPCVIGTKIATEVLSDGDSVEVNGNHGVVKILKKVNN